MFLSSAAVALPAKTSEPATIAAATTRIVTSFKSQPQNLLAILKIGQQRRRGSLVKNRAALQREDAVGQRQHQVEIVLHDHDGGVPAQRVEYPEQFEDHGRREALERL